MPFRIVNDLQGMCVSVAIMQYYRAQVDLISSQFHIDIDAGALIPQLHQCIFINFSGVTHDLNLV